jgi:trk system potassium uptake protein TrkA
MHMIVVGCGRVGATVARTLDEAGHDVVVVDRRPDAFRRLGDDFGGSTVSGVGFDRGVLDQAGVRHADAVMAVTSGDNSNILVARVARELFGVERVVARIYDPRRAVVYERLGISTVASVAWASARILQMIVPGHDAVAWTDPTSSHLLVERRVAAAAAGMPISELAALGAPVVLVTRDGRARVPGPTLLLQEDDRIHLLSTASGVEAADHRLAVGGHP